MESQPPVVLVTGSSGYLGTALIKRLTSEYRPVGLDRRPPDRMPRGSAFVQCDLTDADSVEHAMQAVWQQHGRHITSCVHLAAYYDFSGAPSPLYQTLTVDGTRRLLRGLQRFQIEQFVFSSTHIVMQPADEGEVISEQSPVAPGWEYPRSKLRAEQVVRAERGSVPAVILRLSGVYDADTRVVPIAQQMRRIYERDIESCFFPGDATHGQAFVHLDDAVECIRAAIGRRHELGPYEVFLVAEPEVVSYGDLQERLGELIHGQEWPTIRIPKTVAKAGAWVQDKIAGEDHPSFIKPWMIDLADDHYPIEIEQARRALGWEPTHRLRAMLPEMASRLKRDPEQWYRTNKLKAPDSVLRLTRSR